MHRRGNNTSSTSKHAVWAEVPRRTAVSIVGKICAETRFVMLLCYCFFFFSPPVVCFLFLLFLSLFFFSLFFPFSLSFPSFLGLDGVTTPRKLLVLPNTLYIKVRYIIP
ncbi:hypothetical protein LI328DRAFT_129359 [Trichoderma asperelloides]|nr:hypothetical protein LI328DRAFT_129359 [Trichoderma asperelloides]